MDKQLYRICILVWFGGLIPLTGIDYSLRLISENYYSLGMNETVWFLCQFILTITGLVLLSRAVRHMPVRYAMLLSILTIMTATVFYFMVTWLYVVGTGIDSA